MGILYDRIETDEHTVIRYSRFLAGALLVVAVMFTLLFAVRNLVLALVAYAVMLITISRDMRRVRAELVEANAAGTLSRSGRRLSVKNPLTYYIAKRPPRRKGKRKKAR